MITIHLSGINFDISSMPYIETQEFTYTGQNDHAIETAIRHTYFQWKRDGLLNINCVTEDSQVSEDSAMPHLRWGKPYMFGGGGYPTAYIADFDVSNYLTLTA